MIRSTTSALLLAVIAVLPAAVGAQGVGDDSSPIRAGSWLDHVVVSGSLQAGRHSYDPVPELPGLRGQTAYKLDISVFPGPPIPSWVWGFDFHLWSLSRSYTSVLEGAAESTTSLESTGFGLGTRVGLPMSSPVGVYALGGFTYVSHVMEVEMLPAWFFPYLGNHRKEEGGGYAPYWGLATDIRIGNLAVGVEQRWVRSSATFDSPFAMRDLPLGGSTLYFGVTWYGGRTSGGLRGAR